MILKFRAWDKVINQMFIPNSIHFDSKGMVDGVGSKETIFGIEDFELMQSTGLHDKNGKEIFEGDILEVKDHPYQRSTGRLSGLKTGIEIDGYYLIQYDREIAGYVVGNWKTREVIRYCTVIGNIHEHPELLNQPNE